jgi:hypothetical protein
MAHKGQSRCLTKVVRDLHRMLELPLHQTNWACYSTFLKTWSPSSAEEQNPRDL